MFLLNNKQETLKKDLARGNFITLTKGSGKRETSLREIAPHKKKGF